MKRITQCLLLMLYPLLGFCQLTTISGKIINEEGQVIGGATITFKKTNTKTLSDASGQFTVRQSPARTDTLIISATGYETRLVGGNERGTYTIILNKKVTGLDEVIIQAYGTTTRRLNTGNISQVSAEEIGRQPVGNPLAALEGRVPGLVISQTSGVPGSSLNVEIRGHSSLDLTLSRNDPLFIIDGVPFEPGNQPISQLSSVANNPRVNGEGGLSPLNSINPAEIETIDVLKDADATAIYGSRGANGVILITTKQGKAGKTKLSVNVTTGAGTPARTQQMLNTQQYVAMRKEGLSNEGLTPNATNAPDLVLWDTTRYTDLKKLLIGGSAGTTDAQATVSGGTAQTRFLLGAGYRRESTVYPGDFADKRSSLNFKLNHVSPSKKFSLIFSAIYSSDDNDLPAGLDLATYINLPPNILLHDASGNLAWSEGGVNFSSLNTMINPLSVLLKKYSSVVDNLQGYCQLNYTLFKGFKAVVGLGYNTLNLKETSTSPRASIASNSSVLPSSNFATTTNKSWIVEPQLEYNRSIGKGKLSAMLGGSWQNKLSESNTIRGTNYTNDLLLASVAAAGAITVTNIFSQYKYTAAYGRINYNWQEKYLLNLTGRRDGSSRFGPGKRFANFGAIGTAWIFSKEPFIQKALPFLSFGKLRASYGTTGNDQIGDYRYLELWNTSPFTYQTVPGFQPISLFNPDYHWEINKKAEAAIELGIYKDRILFSLAWFRNRCSNQLVSYDLPVQTGFASVVKNLPALVENSGIEMEVTAKLVEKKNFTWTSIVNLSIPKNKLVSFPGLAASSYATRYVIGEPLSLIRKYNFLGVDPQTGIYKIEDINHDGLYKGADDFITKGSTDPSFYGGWQNALSWKNFDLSFFAEFRKQTKPNYLYYESSRVPGELGWNQPVLVLNRWRQPGDITPIQRFSGATNSPASQAFRSQVSSSTGIYSNASYIRLKNLSFSYSLPSAWAKKIHMENAKIYMQAQNLFVITSYPGGDPETQNNLRLAPLRMLVTGIQFTF